MTIGQLARAAGVNVETIRYYEREGLMERPPRTAAVPRRYSAAALRRLRFIRHAKELGFTLDDIRALLAISASRKSCDDVHRLAESRLTALRDRLRELERARDALASALRACHGGRVSECGVIRALQAEDQRPSHGES